MAMFRKCPVKKKLDKLLEQEGVSGYSVSGKKIIIYVENEEMRTAINLSMFQGYEVEVRNIGRLEAI